jgi:FkbM family methyltransferase
MPPFRWTIGEPSTPVFMRVFANFYVWVFGRKRFYRWNQRLLNLAVRGMGVGNPTLDVISPSENRLLHNLATLENLTVFDVGAHVGEYALRLGRLCPTAQIWSFEPHPGSFKQLQLEARRQGFEALNLALSDRSGSDHLYDYAATTADVGSAHATLHPQVIEGIHHGQAMGLEVQVTTVDDFMESQRIQHLNLLKIDAEGHELAILRGARRAIASDAIDLVQFEFNEMNVVSRVFFKDFYEVLPGYSFYRMVVNGLVSIGDYRPRSHELFILQNVVAIRNDLPYKARLL